MLVPRWRLGLVGGGGPPEGGTRASESVIGWRGVSPLQACVLRLVTEGNCVLVKGGGEQPDVNDQSVTQVNPIQPTCRRACESLVKPRPFGGDVPDPLGLPGNERKEACRAEG